MNLIKIKKFFKFHKSSFIFQNKQTNYSRHFQDPAQDSAVYLSWAESLKAIYFKLIEDELILSGKTGELTERLNQILTSLESVSAASIESERAFSAAGSIVSKIRSRLSCEKIGMK